MSGERLAKGAARCRAPAKALLVLRSSIDARLMSAAKPAAWPGARDAMLWALRNMLARDRRRGRLVRGLHAEFDLPGGPGCRKAALATIHAAAIDADARPATQTTSMANG